MSRTISASLLLATLFIFFAACDSRPLSTAVNQGSDDNQHTDESNGDDGTTNQNNGASNTPDHNGPAGEDPCNGHGDCHWVGSGGDSNSSFEDGESTGAIVDENGSLTLGHGGINRDYFIWIANTAQATLSKFDTETRQEVARYRTGPGSADPSRTSVNSDGDVYVGNRHGLSVTKIAQSDCPSDSDSPHTSTGPNDIKDWGTDDCVLWHTPLPGHGIIRAVAAQDTEQGPVVWIGGWDHTVWKLDGNTGDVLFRTDSPVRPYGFALDEAGNLWIATNSRQLGRIDTTQCVDHASCETEICDENSGVDGDTCVKELIETPGTSYGITVDHKQRVWLGGSVMRYDPSAPQNDRWLLVNYPSFIHGIAADTDGWIYGAGHGAGIIRFDGDEPTLNTAIAGTSGRSVKGVAVDFHDHVWGINLGHNDAFVVNPGAGLHDGTVIAQPTGLVGPYTYSDMTGTQLRFATQQVGVWRRTFEGCSLSQHEYHKWLSLRFSADIPGSSQLHWRIRVASRVSDLADAEWIDVGSSPPLSSPIELQPILTAHDLGGAPALELEVRLQPAADEVAEVLYIPRLDAVDLIADCPRIYL